MSEISHTPTTGLIINSTILKVLSNPSPLMKDITQVHKLCQEAKKGRLFSHLYILKTSFSISSPSSTITLTHYIGCSLHNVCTKVTMVFDVWYIRCGFSHLRRTKNYTWQIRTDHFVILRSPKVRYLWLIPPSNNPIVTAIYQYQWTPFVTITIGLVATDWFCRCVGPVKKSGVLKWWSTKR